jgi:hypothetical protein
LPFPRLRGEAGIEIGMKHGTWKEREKKKYKKKKGITFCWNNLLALFFPLWEMDIM